MNSNTDSEKSKTVELEYDVWQSEEEADNCKNSHLVILIQI